MRLPILLSISLTVSSAFVLSGCANTIRGVGQDAANTVNATQSAGKKVAKAVGDNAVKPWLSVPFMAAKALFSSC